MLIQEKPSTYKMIYWKDNLQIKKYIMKKAFEQEIEKGERNFFIYFSPVWLPFVFAIHTRILTVTPNGEIHKYQVHSIKNSAKRLWYMYIDDQDPMVGDSKYIWKEQPRYSWKQLCKVTWWKGSLAERVVNFMKNDIGKYPYKKTYRFVPWPNSNTFVARIMNAFPKLKIRLPWNAFGKNYKIK